MPGNQQITSLRELIREGLHQDNLGRIISLCHNLAQDSSHWLLFFVLKNIFREIDARLEGEAITVETFNTITDRIAEHAQKLLQDVQQAGTYSKEDLDEMVRTHLRNLGISRSGE
jgi:hypothetical protein